jgi:nitrogen regulatory protein PII
MGIRGVTVTDVKGFGAQGGSRERQAGSEFCEEAFVVKVKVEIVVSQNQVLHIMKPPALDSSG